MEDSVIFILLQESEFPNALKNNRPARSQSHRIGPFSLAIVPKRSTKNRLSASSLAPNRMEQNISEIIFLIKRLSPIRPRRRNT